MIKFFIAWMVLVPITWLNCDEPIVKKPSVSDIRKKFEQSEPNNSQKLDETWRAQEQEYKKINDIYKKVSDRFDNIIKHEETKDIREGLRAEKEENLKEEMRRKRS